MNISGVTGRYFKGEQSDTHVTISFKQVNKHAEDQVNISGTTGTEHGSKQIRTSYKHKTI